MVNDERKEGVAETVRGVVVIVIAGALLGLGFNALAQSSHPRRGLSWTPREEKMPSLEELQPTPAPAPAPPAKGSGAGGPASDLAPSGGGGGLLVLAAVLPARVELVAAAAADTGHAKPAAHKRVLKKTARKSAKAAAPAPGTAATTGKPVAPPASAPPAASAASLPVVPDLDTPIDVKLPYVKKFFDAGPTAAVFVDAREATEYADGHIKGARSVPYDEVVAKPELLNQFKSLGKPIITYCSGGDCELSKDLAKSMLDAGIRKVLVFTDGFPAWKAAGYPIETGAAAK